MSQFRPTPTTLIVPDIQLIHFFDPSTRRVVFPSDVAVEAVLIMLLMIIPRLILLSSEFLYIFIV